jgi:sugar transferase (PEP-CTERM/EpsH1 system associated)
MKILWVTAGRLIPPDTGGKIRSYNILRKLAQQHEVTLLSDYGGPRDLDYEGAIANEMPGTRVIHTGAPETPLRQAVHYLFHLPSAAPYAVTKFVHPEVRRALREMLGEQKFDVAVCDFLSASLNFPEQLPLPCVLFQHNVESSLWQRMADREKNPVRKVSYRIEAAKMNRYERRTLAKFDYVLAVSEHDKQQFLAMDRAIRCEVVPTGVDLAQYTVVPSAPATPPIVTFTGSMDWEPNIDAMEFFCREIWPKVRAEFPDARFQIVGRSPHPRIQRLASDSVEVTGTIPSVQPYIRKATVMVVPLRIGGGTRLKIFEAMAMGKAMVSTSIGAEGLEVSNGHDLLLADDAASFAEAINTLLRDPALRRHYETNAAALAKRYDWSEIARHFAKVLELAIQAHQDGRRTEDSAPQPSHP